ncbi:hypothetical protein ACER0C_030112 [Sarotherodon galilaeus]
MHRGGKVEKKKGVTVQKEADAEEEIGVSEMVESTEVEEREPSLSDLMSILQAHMGQQEAREARQEEVTARQEQKFKALQHQFQLLQLEVQSRTSPVPELPLPTTESSESRELPNISSSPQAQTESSQSLSGQFSLHEPRLEKLTDSDDIEHFLTTFERIALAYRWEKTDWVFRLIPLLTGKARGAYVHMDIDDSLSNDKVKAAILSKYDVNPETYRQRFRSLEVRLDENPKELYARLKDLYGKWIQPKGKTNQEIGEIIILEQYLRMLSPELQVWIREHNPSSAAKAAELAEVFVAARRKGQPWTCNANKMPKEGPKSAQMYHQRPVSADKTPVAPHGRNTWNICMLSSTVLVLLG